MTQLGQETVNGINCTKNKVVVTAKDGHKSEGTMWVSKEGIMVRMVSSDPAMGPGKQVTIDMKNLKIGKQDPALFEIPVGYAKAPSFNMFGGQPPAMPPPAAKNKPAANKVDTATTGRSYTAAREMTNQPAPTTTVDTGQGRAYTAEQKTEEGGATGTLKKGADVLRGVQGLRGLFGR
ncbi:MAG: hypothetical protein A2521_04400 [Deltaproteobacteria bacterium RIFOXYD12_FULL_57_12]|nr:MAG: hypothetical protein A2521_04400 [Deltaproteobacteria bacterium RIFOXYD12_FULL_57_12]